MKPVYICDYVRTPIGGYAGSLSQVRTDDLAAVPLRELMQRNPSIDWSQVDDVLMGCANQAGEDNRNIARMALLLAGMSMTIPGGTINRLCGSGMDAVVIAARNIACGAMDLVVAGGVESMSRAPFVMPKATSAFSRSNEVFDTTIGWRFINPAMEKQFGVDVMPKTAENVAQECGVSREDQDLFAYNSQQKAARAQANGWFSKEIVPVNIPQKKSGDITVDIDEHMRPDITLNKLSQLRPLFGSAGTVTAGNSSGVNDGAAAMIIASEDAMKRYDLIPLAKISGASVAGVEPRIMGLGPEPAVNKICHKLSLSISDFDVIELNEAFASQSLACLRRLGVEDDDPRVNPYGGAIALGHPLGMSGARITGTAARAIAANGAQRVLAAMCIGVGQGIAIALERV